MPIPPPLLKGVRREYDIDYLFYRNPQARPDANERTLLGLALPPWQRQEVWTVEQSRRFVESQFLGLGCGYYVITSSDWFDNGDLKPMSAWLLDGQQRISALRDFLIGNMTVFGNVLFSGMSLAEQLRFKRISFPCFELDYTDNEDALKELYDRLNFGGTPHSPEQRVLPASTPIQ